MKSILMTSSALLLVSGLAAAQAQDEACTAEIDAFTRDYEEAMAAFGNGEALSAEEQAELFGLRTTAENAYRTGNLEMCEQAITRARLMLDSAIAPTAMTPRELIGMEVRNAADEYLGEVEEVTLDPMSGRIAYILVEHGGFLGIGDSLYPVPWRAITYSPGAESLLLDLTEERLENAPRHVEEDATAKERRAWLMSVHTYYGVEPYWQDSFASLAMSGASGTTIEPADGTAGGAAADSAVLTTSEPTQENGTQASAIGTAATEGVDAKHAVGTAEPEGNGEQGGSVAAVQGAETGKSPGQDQASSSPSDERAAVVALAPAGTAQDDNLSKVLDRLDQMESRISELSEQGVGEEVRSAIGSLETRVQELAESQPGEEIRSAVEELQARVQELAESQPGEDVREALAALEARVQQLAEQQPGQEMRAAIDSLEEQVQELSESAPGQELRQMMESMQERMRQLSANGAAGSDGTASAGVMALDPGRIEQSDSAQPSATVGGGSAAIDGQSAQSGGAATSLTTTATGAGATDREVETPASGSTAGAGEATASTAGKATSGSDATASVGAAASGAAVPPAERSEPTGAVAAAGNGEEVEPCETGITRLEEDLARAEQEGIAVREAKTELEAAQAMMRRASEALCRAAIKRARDELVAQGFEPTAAN